jgi:hypothetical protein
MDKGRMRVQWTNAQGFRLLTISGICLMVTSALPLYSSVTSNNGCLMIFLEKLVLKSFLLSAIPATVMAMSASVLAQQGEAVRVRGTISSIENNTVSVQTASGQTTKVVLAKDYRVLVYSPIKFSDVSANAYVAVASSPSADGGLKAMGLVVFPEAMRGLNEGTKHWDLTPGSRMTNATVGVINKQGSGEIVVTFGKGDEQRIQITDQTRVSTFVLGESGALKAGSKVVVFATKDADGSITSGMVGIGKDGYMPPI